jgi:shikimate kinase
MARGIYLVGFSGSGKTTIAKAIGEKLQWPSCDLDDVIVEQSGVGIAEIFKREGEAGFRLREAEALRSVSSKGLFVVATGGGTIVRPENRTYMASNGWVICLEAEPETLLARMQRQTDEADPKAIRPMLESAYGLADWTIHTDDLTQEQVAAEVIRAADILEKSIGTASNPAADLE